MQCMQLGPSGYFEMSIVALHNIAGVQHVTQRVSHIRKKWTLVQCNRQFRVESAQFSRSMHVLALHERFSSGL